MAQRGSTTVRRPKELTLETLERQLFQSTPVGAARRERGYRLDLDLTAVTYADFAGAATLVAAVEGALRRDIEVALQLPSSHATEEEYALLSRGVTRQTPAGIRSNILDTRDRVRNRSRVVRYLESVGFFESIRLDHLPSEIRQRLQVTEQVGAAEQFQSGPPTSVQLLARVPLQWLQLNSSEDALHARNLVESQLGALGAPFSLRFIAYELIDNAHQHSLWEHQSVPLNYRFDTASRACLFGLTRETRGEVEVFQMVAMDGGVGIPYTLRPSQRGHGLPPIADASLVSVAFEDSSSRRSDGRPAPRGLGTVRRLVQRDGGFLHAASGRGRVVISDSGRKALQAGFVHGTAVSVTYPVVSQAPPVSSTVSSECDYEVAFRTFDAMGRLVFIHEPFASEGRARVEVVVVPETLHEAALEELTRHATSSEDLLVLLPSRGDSATLELAFARLLNCGAASVVCALSAGGLRVGDSAANTDARAGSLRAAVYQSARTLAKEQIETLIIDQVAIEPIVTWSLGTVAKWVPPERLLALSVAPLLPYVLATELSLITDSVEPMEIVLTDRALESVVREAATWFAHPVRTTVLQNPHEPDVARFFGIPPSSTVVLSSVMNQGGAVGPVLRALRKSGRREIKVYTFVNAGDFPVDSFSDAYGHSVPVAFLCRFNLDADQADTESLEAKATVSLHDAFDRAYSLPLYAAAVATQGALRLGHFHSRHRRYLSVVVDPARLVERGSPLSEFCLNSLAVEANAVALEVDASSLRVVGARAGGVWARILAERLLERLTQPSGSGSELLIIVDWGAVSGNSLYDEAFEATQAGARNILLAVGVDRSEQSLLGRYNEITVHHQIEVPGRDLLSDPELITLDARIFARSAGRLPVDPQTYVDCPICKVERSTMDAWRAIGIAGLLPSVSHLDARTLSELPLQAQDDGLFGAPLSPVAMQRILAWRSVIFEGVREKEIAFGLLQMLNGRECTSEDVLAIAQVFCYDAHLLDARPWTNQAFRHALAMVAAEKLRDHIEAYDSGALASLLTVVRLSDKTVFLTMLNTTFGVMPESLQLAALGSLATLVSRHYHQGDKVGEAAHEAVLGLFETNYSGVVGAAVARLQSYVISRELVQQQATMTKWARFRKYAQLASKHLSPSAERERLLGYIALAEHDLFTEDLRLAAPEDWRALRDVWLQGLLPHLRDLDPVFRWLKDRYNLAWLIADDEGLRISQEMLDLLDAFFIIGRECDTSDVRRALASLTSVEAQSLSTFVLSCPVDIAVELQHLLATEARLPITIRQLPASAIPVFVVQPVLRNLLHHLIENGVKHESNSVEFDVQLVSSTVARLRVVYRTTKASTAGSTAIGNSEGGLSEAQFGGDLSAFGGGVSFPKPAAARQFVVHIDLARWSE